MSALKIIEDICVGGKAPNRANILAYEEIAKKMPQLEIPVTHHIHGGMYGREITIPKDTILTGQIYKFDHFDVMIGGDITVSTDTGETKRFTGYNCFKGMAGKKRAGYAHQDTTWITFHPFTGSDGEDIQKFITAETFEDLEQFNTIVNRADYETMVNSMGMTEEDIRVQVENKDDLTDMPHGYDDLYVDKSGIEGSGFFTKEKINAGDTICHARIGAKRTPAGRYINHALQPNSRIEISGSDVLQVAIKDIEPGEEITSSYRDVLTKRFNQGDLLCQE